MASYYSSSYAFVFALLLLGSEMILVQSEADVRTLLPIPESASARHLTKPKFGETMELPLLHLEPPLQPAKSRLDLFREIVTHPQNRGFAKKFWTYLVFENVSILVVLLFFIKKGPAIETFIGSIVLWVCTCVVPLSVYMFYSIVKLGNNRTVFYSELDGVDEPKEEDVSEGVMEV